jgi:hypothetical protein
MPVAFLPADPSLGFLGHAFSLERGSFLGTNFAKRVQDDTAAVLGQP